MNSDFYEHLENAKTLIGKEVIFSIEPKIEKLQITDIGYNQQTKEFFFLAEKMGYLLYINQTKLLEFNPQLLSLLTSI